MAMYIQYKCVSSILRIDIYWLRRVYSIDLGCMQERFMLGFRSGRVGCTNSTSSLFQTASIEFLRI